MKLLVETNTKENLYLNNVDGIILSLKDYSVQSDITYTLEEIKKIVNKNNSKEIFININKNLLNADINPLKEILLELDKLNITGIFYYDLALVRMKEELNLKTDLVWSQTHMVNNYKTCNYYHSKGVKYALLGKEITLEEIKEIIEKSTITAMVEVVSVPSVAFSKRKLITNYYKDLNKTPKNKLTVSEKVSKKDYILDQVGNLTKKSSKKTKKYLYELEFTKQTPSEEAKQDSKTKCINCGAPASKTAEKCPYCGTLYQAKIKNKNWVLSGKRILSTK